MQSRVPVWLWLLPLLTCGCLAPAAPFAIAVKTGSARAWLWFAGFATAWVVPLVVLGSSDELAESTTGSLVTFLFFLSALGATVYAVVKAKEIDWGPDPLRAAPVPPAAPGAYDPNAAAIASVQAARQKRLAAMQIVQRDPDMARELRIGRPDLPRHYDDGGLVDVNNAPAEALVRGLGLTEAAAAQVLAARDRLGRFQHPDDLMNLAGLDLDTFHRIDDRVVLL